MHSHPPEKPTVLSAGVAKEQVKEVLRFSNTIVSELDNGVSSRRRCLEPHMELANVGRDPNMMLTLGSEHFSQMEDPNHEFGTALIDGMGMQRTWED
jgi:hypothetical protein